MVADETRARFHGTAALGRAVRIGFAGVVLGLMSVVLAVSLAAVVFAGPLQPYLAQGARGALMGGTALGITGAFALSYRGTIAMPQDITAIILAIGAGGLAVTMAGVEPDRLLASVLVYVAIGTMLVGLAFLVVGTARLGSLARCVPFPVLGGFLAGTGYLLCDAAFNLALEADGSAGPMLRIGPAAGLAVAMVWIARRFPDRLGLPMVLSAALAGFYLVLPLFGVSLGRASALGLLLGSKAGGDTAGPMPHAVLFDADYGAILGQAGSLMVLVCMAVVGALLNASALEVAVSRPVDLNRDMRGAGLGNILAALTGGLPGYHIFGETLLGHRLVGDGSRWIGGMSAAACGLAVLAGPDLIGALPVWVFAAMLGYLGLDLLWQWLWIDRRAMPMKDFAIVLLIVAVTATVGYLQAVGVGLLAACALFIVAFSRIDLVRNRLTGALRRSRTERGPEATRLLDERGGEVLIYELQGYIFFGSAARLHGRLVADLDREPHDLVLCLSRMTGADVSAAVYLERLMAAAAERGVRLHVADAEPRLLRRLEVAAARTGAWLWPTLDAALSAIEDGIIGESDPAGSEAISGFPALLRRAEAEGLAAPFAVRNALPGAPIIEPGTRSDSLIFLVSGRLEATVQDESGRPRIVASFLPGAVVGEIGFLGDLPRTARVTASVPSAIRIVTRADLDHLAGRDPELERLFREELAKLMARRLARTTALLARLG